MDEMKIKSGFMTGIIAKLVKKMIKKHLGCDMDISIQELTLLSNDEKAHIHIDIDGIMTREELKKLLKEVGL